MHKMSPRGPKHYIFGNNFYSKNFRKHIFHVFLHFNARKHMRSSFYLKWTEFTKNRYFGSTWTHNWNKIHNFLWIGSTSGKNDDVTCFLTLKKRNTWNLSFLGSLSKHGHQKHTAWILWDQKLRYFIIVMFLLTEISTSSEPDCYT